MYEQYLSLRLVYDEETGVYLGAYQTFDDKADESVSKEKAAELLEEFAANASTAHAFKMRLRAQQLRDMDAPPKSPEEGT